MFLTNVSVILLDATHRGELTLGTCDRLKGHSVHARTVFKHLLHFMENSHQTLEVRSRSQRMDIVHPWHLYNLFIHTRIVFHCAGTKGIESRVNPVTSGR